MVPTWRLADLEQLALLVEEALPAAVEAAEAHNNGVAFEAGVLRHERHGHDCNAYEDHEDVAAAVVSVDQDRMIHLVAVVDQDIPLVGEGQAAADPVEAEVDTQRPNTYRVLRYPVVVEDLPVVDMRPKD